MLFTPPLCPFHIRGGTEVLAACLDEHHSLRPGAGGECHRLWNAERFQGRVTAPLQLNSFAVPLLAHILAHPTCLGWPRGPGCPDDIGWGAFDGDQPRVFPREPCPV